MAADAKIEFSIRLLMIVLVVYTGGPPLIQKSLTRFLLPQFLAYVHVSRGISINTVQSH